MIGALITRSRTHLPFLEVDGISFIGDTANAHMTYGLTINQGASDNEIIALKSSDVAHGGTVLAETDTFSLFEKAEDAAGGLLLRGLKDSGGLAGRAVKIDGMLAENADTTKSTAAHAIVEVYGTQISGTDRGDIVADGNVFLVMTRISGSDTTCLIVDEDGDLWLNGGITLPNGEQIFNGSNDSAAVADEVAIGGYEISAGHRALAISSEEAVVTETDETKFSHKIPVRINGATYNMMLCAT